MRRSGQARGDPPDLRSTFNVSLLLCSAVQGGNEYEKESWNRCYELLRCRRAGRPARSACRPLQLCCFYSDHWQARPHRLYLRTGTDPGCWLCLPLQPQRAGCLTVSVIIHQHDRDAFPVFFDSDSLQLSGVQALCVKYTDPENEDIKRRQRTVSCRQIPPQLQWNRHENPKSTRLINAANAGIQAPTR